MLRLGSSGSIFSVPRCCALMLLHLSLSLSHSLSLFTLSASSTNQPTQATSGVVLNSVDNDDDVTTPTSTPTSSFVATCFSFSRLRKKIRSRSEKSLETFKTRLGWLGGAPAGCRCQGRGFDSGRKTGDPTEKSTENEWTEKKSRPETEIENRSEKNGCFFSLIETKMTMVLDSNDADDAMFCVARLSF